MSVTLKLLDGRKEETYASLFAPTYPPSPMDIAPAANSANPPSTTTLVSPSAERPALRANGTVRPSDKPRMASETMRGLMRERVLPVLEDSETASSSSDWGFEWKVEYER